jgi:uncharacterized protein (UPF0335 family)
MSDIGHNSQSGEPIAADLLKSLVERVERLEAEIAEMNSDKSEVYKEGKSNGFDVKILRKVIALRRKDPAERYEEDALLDTYLSALGAA